MAWTTPKTWASGYVVLAADLNTHLRDNLNVTAPAVMSSQGDVLFASGSNTPARLAKSTTPTQYLANTGTNNNPAWNEVALATGVSGTLPVGNGGTGQTSLTTGAILIGNATSGVTMVTQTTKGQILIGDGTGPPQMLTVGSNDQVLTADSGQTTGVKWASALSGNDIAESMAKMVDDGTYQVLYMLGGSDGRTLNSTNDPAEVGLGFRHTTGTSSTSLSPSSVVDGAWHVETGSANGVGIFFGTHITAAETAGGTLAAANDWTILCQAYLTAGSATNFFYGLAEGVAPLGLTNNSIGWRVVGTGNLIGFVDNGGTETTVDSSVSPSGQVHNLKVVISAGGGTVKFFRNGSQVGSDVTTNIPSSTSMMIMGGGGRTSNTDGQDLEISTLMAYREV